MRAKDTKMKHSEFIKKSLNYFKHQFESIYGYPPDQATIQDAKNRLRSKWKLNDLTSIN